MSITAAAMSAPSAKPIRRTTGDEARALGSALYHGRSEPDPKWNSLPSISVLHTLRYGPGTFERLCGNHPRCTPDCQLHVWWISCLKFQKNPVGVEWRRRACKWRVRRGPKRMCVLCVCCVCVVLVSRRGVPRTSGGLVKGGELVLGQPR